jgi:hypothetical protein
MRVYRLLQPICFFMLAVGGLAFGQTPGVKQAVVTTSNLEGDVTLVVAGVKMTLPVSGVNSSTTASEGTVQHDATNVNVGAPAVANLATIEAPHSQANFASTRTTTTLAGGASASSIHLAQDSVTSTNVSGQSYCTFDSARGIHCVGSTSLGSVTVNGAPVSIPAQPIPVGYQLATVGTTLAVTVPGLGLSVNIPVSGALKVNDFVFDKTGTNQLSITHAPLHLVLKGSVNVLSIGVVSAQVDLKDVTDTSVYTTDTASTPTTNSVPPNSIDCSKLADGDYADPQQSCTADYYSCASGTSIPRKCLDGFFFNSEQGFCDEAKNIPQCGGKPATSRTSLRALLAK